MRGFRVDNHVGEDWNFGLGTNDLGMPVYAAADGDVVFAANGSDDGTWQGVIIILHTGGGFRLPSGGVVDQVKTLYGHLDVTRINEWVMVGSRVVRGQQIGVIGPSEGPHLHFEVRTDVSIGVGRGYTNDATGWVSPSDFINANRAFGLHIHPAVQITWATATNRAYQLLSAAAIDGPFMPDGNLVEGTGGVVGRFSSGTNDQKFFKVEETNASGMAWLEGVWEGLVCQVLPGVVTNHFVARFGITNSLRSFGWTSSPPGGNSCIKSLFLLSYSDAQARFYSSVQSGGCIDSTVILSRVDETNIVCAIYALEAGGGAGGLLVKR